MTCDGKLNLAGSEERPQAGSEPKRRANRGGKSFPRNQVLDRPGVMRRPFCFQRGLASP